MFWIHQIIFAKTPAFISHIHNLLCPFPLKKKQTNQIYEIATGFARSIPAGQSLRQQPQYPTTITSSNATNDAGHSLNKVRANISHKNKNFAFELSFFVYLALQSAAATIESPPVTPPVVSVPSGSSVAAIAASINTQISSTPFVSVLIQCSIQKHMHSHHTFFSNRTIICKQMWIL